MAAAPPLQPPRAPSPQNPATRSALKTGPEAGAPLFEAERFALVPGELTLFHDAERRP
jgi:hypothetical protein